MDAGDQLFASQHADAMAGAGKADLVAGIPGIEHLVPGLERGDLGTDSHDDPATALRSLVDRDDQAARCLGLVERLHNEIVIERLERYLGSLSHRVEHGDTLAGCIRPPGGLGYLPGSCMISE